MTKNDSIARHVLKTLSYRIVSTLVTFVTAYIVGVSIEISALIGIGEILIKPIMYFMHERIWYKHIKVGVK
jgi:uncharacterized membrane protein